MSFTYVCTDICTYTRQLQLLLIIFIKFLGKITSNVSMHIYIHFLNVYFPKTFHFQQVSFFFLNIYLYNEPGILPRSLQQPAGNIEDSTNLWVVH